MMISRPIHAPAPRAAAAHSLIALRVPTHTRPPAQRACTAARPRAAANSSSSNAPTTVETATAPSELAAKRCEPCEAARDAETAMGLHAAFDMRTAHDYLAHLQPGWRVVEDDKRQLRIRRRFRTKNFVKVGRV